MTANEREGLRLLGIYTAGRFRLWVLAGPAKATCRQHIMSAILGRKAKRADSGVFAMEEHFRAMFPSTSCRARWEDEFSAWAKEQLEPAAV